MHTPFQCSPHIAHIILGYASADFSFTNCQRRKSEGTFDVLGSCTEAPQQTDIESLCPYIKYRPVHYKDEKGPSSCYRTGPINVCRTASRWWDYSRSAIRLLPRRAFLVLYMFSFFLVQHNLVSMSCSLQFSLAIWPFFIEKMAPLCEKKAVF